MVVTREEIKKLSRGKYKNCQFIDIEGINTQVLMKIKKYTKMYPVEEST